MEFLSRLAEGVALIAPPIGIEWIIILAVVAILLLFGPTKLPELARGIGKALGEFRRGKMEIEKQLRDEMRDERKEESVTAYRTGGAQKVVEISPRLSEAARELGLEVLGRKERYLKMDIITALDASSTEKLKAVARILGVSPEGLDTEQLKDRIGEALGI